jgi:precorrin-6A synthase
MKKILIVGIGAGDPEHVTVQAVKALNTVDVFFVLEKGPAKEKLAACAAILAWGDPALYDSTIRNVEALAQRMRDVAYEVIPGISSIAVLAARHRITLNRVGRPVEITTGRRLREALPANDVVVRLDGEDSYESVIDQDLEIFWGAYLGTPDEILIAGRLKDVAGEIKRRRAEARRVHGWIMDIYLLRRTS